MPENVRALASERPVRIVQITDLHLRSRPEASLDWDVPGTVVQPERTLERVLGELDYEEPWLDLVLATGDLAQDPVPDVYERLAHKLNATRYPVSCLAGNHDDADLLYDILGRYSLTSRVVALHDWVIILLDSSRPQLDSGRLAREELDLLDETLLRHLANHALIALHHNPVPVASCWLDAIGLANSREFFEVLDAHDKVRGVVFGHIHQEFAGQRNSVLMLGSPSTCVQFTARHDRLQIDGLPPAYRWLELHWDGRIKTGIGHIMEDIRRRA